MHSWLSEQDTPLPNASALVEIKSHQFSSTKPLIPASLIDIKRRTPLTKSNNNTKANVGVKKPTIKVSLNTSHADQLVASDESETTDENGNTTENDDEMSGTAKTPPCAGNGRFYCTYKEDYPNKVVTEITRYYKWPLEKLFRDLKNQVMPKLANDNYGGLVCDSVTRVVRPGWSRNTNGRWLVVINTEQFQQYVTEVVCRHGTGSYCNFIPPCYHSTCRQRYNTQKLLVIDPWNPYKGPFMSEFLFPSCCICQIPENDQQKLSSLFDVKTDRKARNEL